WGGGAGNQRAAAWAAPSDTRQVQHVQSPAAADPTSVSGTAAALLEPAKWQVRPIERIRVGDRVWAADPESGRAAWKRVVRVYHRQSDHLRQLRIQDAGGDSSRLLETTDDHPFWVVERGWTAAGALRPGDQLRQVDGKTAHVVGTARRPVTDGVPVFNFETEDLHTYFVLADRSSQPLLVHNCDPASLGKLYHYTGADPARIMERGLRPGASGKVWLTPNGSLTPTQAQLDLAMPPNRGLPQHLLEIDVKTLRELGIEVPQAQRVGRQYNLPGGDLEVPIPASIPPRAIRPIR
ncbi:MAG: hypothetical protein J5I93_08180, partial [Pirellulaceae bacterium]|nr:hypothetical protein [Pirellulaceae bacterium]